MNLTDYPLGKQKFAAKRTGRDKWKRTAGQTALL